MNDLLKEEARAHQILLDEPVRGVGVRISRTLARKWLMDNHSIICPGQVFHQTFHLEISHLGLGVCKVVKAPVHVKETTFTSK